MKKYIVVYLEPVPPDVEGIIRSRLPPEFELRVRMGSETVEDVLPNADFFLVATTPLPASIFEMPNHLRLIQHQGVGYNKTDVRAAAVGGTPVAICPAGTSIGVAEHVFLLILSLYKKLLIADPSVRHGEWLQWELRPESFEIYGKTMGIIGLGRIGKEVALRGRVFGARLMYYDIQRVNRETEQDLDLRFVPMEECITRADILTLHLPLTRATHHFISSKELAKMKPSAVLINTSRGPLVDEAALVEALKTGALAGAGLDVFEDEPPTKDNPLFQLNNVVLTPHISAGTGDALVAKMDACFANMLRVSRGEPPVDIVIE
jgi:phosphoglycerate dehydrogenase-like enzyme